MLDFCGGTFEACFNTWLALTISEKFVLGFGVLLAIFIFLRILNKFVQWNFE